MGNKLSTSIKKKIWTEYKLFDNLNNNMIKIETETGLHYKVVDFIRKLYPNTRIIAQCGEKQNTTFKRIDS